MLTAHHSIVHSNATPLCRYCSPMQCSCVCWADSVVQLVARLVDDVHYGSSVVPQLVVLRSVEGYLLCELQLVL